jgi:hypothetical protein
LTAQMIGSMVGCHPASVPPARTPPGLGVGSGAANTGFNQSADAVTCSSCGFIHQFVAGVVEPVDEV